MKVSALILALAFLMEPVEYNCNSATHWSCDGPRAATAGDGHSTVTVYQRRVWVWLDGRELWK